MSDVCLFFLFFIITPTERTDRSRQKERQSTILLLFHLLGFGLIPPCTRRIDRCREGPACACLCDDRHMGLSLAISGHSCPISSILHSQLFIISYNLALFYSTGRVGSVEQGKERDAVRGRYEFIRSYRWLCGLGRYGEGLSGDSRWLDCEMGSLTG